jgi:hypothetical protein
LSTLKHTLTAQAEGNLCRSATVEELAVHGRESGLKPYTTQDSRNHDTVVKHTAMTKDSHTVRASTQARSHDPGLTHSKDSRALTDPAADGGSTSGGGENPGTTELGRQDKGEVTSSILSARPSTRDPS